VTGTSRGLGAALARGFVNAGARVLVHARTNEAARVSAQASGATAFCAGDLADPALGVRLAEVAAEALGGLDVLVLNAGVLGPMQALADTDFAAFREVMALNVDAQLRLFVAALRHLTASRGAVLWMSSGLGRFAAPRYGAYCASKHALEGLAKLAAVEHAGQLTSIAIAPGMVQTDMLARALGADGTGAEAEAAADLTPYARPDDTARRFVRLIATLGPSLDIGDR
jgi:NAD(P)-dependent dehydrogenase (short-subunit alcohol dehydrogenase family)